MKQNQKEQLKKTLIESVKADIKQKFNYSIKDIEEMVAACRLEERIERYPLIFSHMTSIQVLNVVFDWENDEEEEYLANLRNDRIEKILEQSQGMISFEEAIRLSDEEGQK